MPRDRLLQLREKFQVLAKSYNTPEDQFATLLQSLALSLRKIPAADQNTVHLKDR